MTTTSFAGHLALDPEFTTGDSGTLCAHVRVAVSDGYRDRSGEWKARESTFWDAYAWGEAAEHIQNARLSKGNAVVMEARIDTSRWTDTDGKPRSRMFLSILAFGRNILRPPSTKPQPQGQNLGPVQGQSGAAHYPHQDAAFNHQPGPGYAQVPLEDDFQAGIRQGL